MKWRAEEECLASLSRPRTAGHSWYEWDRQFGYRGGSKRTRAPKSIHRRVGFVEGEGLRPDRTTRNLNRALMSVKGQISAISERLHRHQLQSSYFTRNVKSQHTHTHSIYMYIPRGGLGNSPTIRHVCLVQYLQLHVQSQG